MVRRAPETTRKQAKPIAAPVGGRGRFDYADRFAPEAWTEGDAAESWSFNHLSHGLQCPGADIALFVGKAVWRSC